MPDEVDAEVLRAAVGSLSSRELVAHAQTLDAEVLRLLIPPHRAEVPLDPYPAANSSLTPNDTVAGDYNSDSLRHR